MSRVDTTRAAWRKSTRSGAGSGGGQCVEVAPLGNGHVAVRDSKNPHGSEHAFGAREWRAFVVGIKRGDYR